MNVLLLFVIVSNDCMDSINKGTLQLIYSMIHRQLIHDTLLKMNYSLKSLQLKYMTASLYDKS